MGVGDVARVSSADCLLSASFEPEPIKCKPVEIVKKEAIQRTSHSGLHLHSGRPPFLGPEDRFDRVERLLGAELARRRGRQRHVRRCHHPSTPTSHYDL